MKKWLAYLFVLLVVGSGAFIRLAPIVSGDTLFQFDHGRDLWDVKKIVYDGDLTLIGPDTGLHGVFNGPYHYYLLALPIWLTDGHPLSGSYFNALLHILAIYLCFELGRRMHNENSKSQILNSKEIQNSKFKEYDGGEALLFGILVATVYAFARGAVGATVFFWNPNWIPALMVPWVYGMWMGVIRKKGWGLVVAGFFGGIAANVEVAYGIFLVPTYVAMVSVLWPGAWRMRWSWLGLVAYGVHFVWHLVFDIRNNWLMTSAIVGLFSGSNISLGVSVPLQDRFWTRALELYAATGENLSAHENSGWSMFLTILICICCLWFFFQSRKLQITNYKLQINSNKQIPTIQKEIFFFLLPFIVYYLCFLVYPRVAWPWYWTGLQTVFYFLCGYVVWRASMVGGWVSLLGLALVGFWLAITLPYYFREPTFLEREPGRFSHMMRVVEDVFEDAGNEQFAVYTFTPPVRDHAFGYLFWWRGRTQYGYEPYTAYALRDGEEIPETVYLVIDPPCASYDTEESCKAKSVQLKGWLETSTPQGKVLWERDYAGRLRVIKREKR